MFSHPETGKPVLCFHLGMIGAFVQNFGTKQQKIFSPEQSQQVLDQIQVGIYLNVNKKQGKCLPVLSQQQ